MPDDTETPEPSPVDYTPVTLKPRHNGWTAARQRTFLTVLAETGSISHACSEAGISARSAYRLRARPEATAFAQGWEQALKIATLRLTTLAFERATRGTVKEIWKNGELVGQTRTPSDKLLMFVLAHLLPSGVADPAAQQAAMIDAAGAAFPHALDRLTDSDVPLAPLEYREFHPEPPDAGQPTPVEPGDLDEDW